jgi:hypothetical protein
MITPMWKDKRFLLTANTISAVLALVAYRQGPQRAGFDLSRADPGAFMGQSQWGQTKRMTTIAPPAPDAQP